MSVIAGGCSSCSSTPAYRVQLAQDAGRSSTQTRVREEQNESAAAQAAERKSGGDDDSGHWLDIHA